LGQLEVFSSLFVIFSFPEFPFLSSIHIFAVIIRCQNNLSSGRRQLVSELKRFLGVNFHHFAYMTGGCGWHGQVPNEEVSCHECSLQDVMIEDLQRQVAELT
jgi:hypothetical protein